MTAPSERRSYLAEKIRWVLLQRYLLSEVIAFLVLHWNSAYNRQSQLPEAIKARYSPVCDY